METHIRDTFRRWGYLQAELDPFGRLLPEAHAELDAIDKASGKKWRKIYCGPIGSEFMHIPIPERCEWIAKRLEGKKQPVDEHYILNRLATTTFLERYIHTRYIGTKRFSLEGCPSLIPLLDSILEQAAEQNVDTVMIGMSHRGRLNTMVHIAGTSPSNIFAGFEDVDPKSTLGSGDVKYHRGATGVYETRTGKHIPIHVASNPSHLEAINPVVMGRARAREDRLQDFDRGRVLAVILHGDAAFAGQGVASETLNYMTLKGFRIGGTIHVIVNNMIGFTAEPQALHSSRFSADAAKRLPIPIFHVNSEHPEDVVRVGKLATEYRFKFKSDAVIDLIGFRRYGHSEIDDPTITQPLLYQKIKDHPMLYQSYAERIGVSGEELAEIEEDITKNLTEELEKGKAMTKQPLFTKLPNYWEDFTGGFYNPSMEVDTAVPEERIREVAEAITKVPEDFHVHPKLTKLLDMRLKMGHGERPVDWGMGEALALGTLLKDEVPVRLTGQDSRRGTFAHRHAVLFDYENGEQYIPLAHVHDQQGYFGIYDSMLSEAAAVGFEYGYSRDYPEALVCWEAQFGDFANGAQIIVDQFLTAGEDKWGLLSGLVMLLPHGYEGQGPEHSSARMERYLQLCGEDNIQVCQASNAAQYFHLLRRQALRKWRKPLIVFTPKSMLRAQAASSPLEDFTSNRFLPVLNQTPDCTNPERILLSSGKITHELKAERKRREDTTTAIISIEQLYPFPDKELREIFNQYLSAKSIVWVQEEPGNMGALFFVRPYLEKLTKGRFLSTIKRSPSASPATGSSKAHELEQQAIIKHAFASYA